MVALVWYSGIMSIKNETIVSISTLDFVSDAEYSLISHICQRFHRDTDELCTYTDRPFLTEDVSLGKRKCTGVPSEIRGLSSTYNGTSWDYMEYGEGAEGDTDVLESIVNELEAANITIRGCIRKLALNTKARIERSKLRGYTGPRLNWAEEWKETKIDMRAYYEIIKQNQEEVRTIKGELKARAHTSQPWLTPYMTSDMCGTCEQIVDEDPYLMDPAVHGMDAPTHRGDILSPPRKPKHPTVIRRRKK